MCGCRIPSDEIIQNLRLSITDPRLLLAMESHRKKLFFGAQHRLTVGGNELR